MADSQNPMSEQALAAAKEHIKAVYRTVEPALSVEEADRMAQIAVDAIDWNNSTLMHKDLTWIAHDIYSRYFKL